MNLRIPCTVTNKQYIFKDNCEESTTGIDNQYDDKGRITATGYNGYNIYYQYDSDGQLVRVDDNYACSDTSVYTYDSRGNVTEKKVYPFTRDETITSSPTETTTFTYANTGWKDLLVSVNGVELTYDANGNVLTYGDREYTWNTGRNLASITDGTDNYSYTYDENGIRTSKTVNGVTTYYNTKDGVILSQSDGTNTMYFLYDTSGTPLGFILNGTQYFYMTNQMGDVIAIIDANYTPVCEYIYDEWGNILDIAYVDEENAQQIAVATANPLRYRGYYYDVETGYYYLQSRYYDPSICRFINADIPEITGITKDIVTGTNLFVYCNNDPENNVDYNGFLSTRWIEYPIDIAIAILSPNFYWPYDIIGNTVERFCKVFGIKRVSTYLLTTAIPKFRGMFSKGFTLIRTAIWRTTGYFISNAVTNSINRIMNAFIRALNDPIVSNVLYAISCFFSPGAFVAGVLDFFTDGCFNGNIVVRRLK